MIVKASKLDLMSEDIYSVSLFYIYFPIEHSYVTFVVLLVHRKVKDLK